MSLSSSFRHARCGIITHASSQRMPLMITDKQAHLDPADLTSAPLMKKQKKICAILILLGCRRGNHSLGVQFREFLV